LLIFPQTWPIPSTFLPSKLFIGAFKRQLSTVQVPTSSTVGICKHTLTISIDAVYWIQISGATALAAAELISETFEPGTSSPELFDDVEDIENYRSHIQQHSFRAGDNYMLNVTKGNSNIKTAVVLPPVIYGPGEGPVNQRSIQVPGLIRYALQNGRGAQVGKGLNRWGNVHIRDLGRLFGALVEKAAKQDTSDDLWGANGIYFTDVGEMVSRPTADKRFLCLREQLLTGGGLGVWRARAKDCQRGCRAGPNLERCCRGVVERRR
jgi:hypothetical protein